MDNELYFRVATILLFTVVLSIGLYHRIRAARAGGKVSRQEEGVPVMVLLRLCGFGAWISLLTYMINPGWMAWSAVGLPSWMRWMGAGLVLLSIPLIYWMFRSLGKNVTDTVAIREEHRLVTDGPYRWVRHPMYSFSLLLFTGFSLLTANAFLGLLVLLTLLLIYIRTSTEEAKLTEAFGDEYRIYMKRTGRFFPRLFRNES